MTEQDGHVVLLIEDDGRGFDQRPTDEADAASGLGLVSMRERAALVGGRLEIESRRGHGTSIYVRIPNRVEPSADLERRIRVRLASIGMCGWPRR